MRILAIETSCDETAVSIVEGDGGLDAPAFRVLAQAVSSQIELHAKWGGVVPNLAKREHEINLVPLLEQVLIEAGIKTETTSPASTAFQTEIETYLVREPELAKIFLRQVPRINTPKIDAIAVTV